MYRLSPLEVRSTQAKAPQSDARPNIRCGIFDVRCEIVVWKIDTFDWTSQIPHLNPNVAYLSPGKTRKSASTVVITGVGIQRWGKLLTGETTQH
jgi:hypothetical protein